MVPWGAGGRDTSEAPVGMARMEGGGCTAASFLSWADTSLPPFGVLHLTTFYHDPGLVCTETSILGGGGRIDTLGDRRRSGERCRFE